MTMATVLLVLLTLSGARSFGTLAKRAFHSSSVVERKSHLDKVSPLFAGDSEEEPPPPSHFRWPSMNNIHRILDDGKFEVSDFDNIIVSEKLDGANLGIEVDKEGNLKALHGRNSVLWHTGMRDEDPFDRTYGSVSGTFASLKEVMEPLKQFALNLQESTNVLPIDEKTSSFLIYGEWFTPKDQNTPSWHPFGVSVIRDNGADRSTYSMTLKLHEALTEQGLDPPKILFQGINIAKAVKSIFPEMLNPPPSGFEGVVMTLDSHETTPVQRFGLGVKWKIAAYEEQPQFVLTNDSDEIKPVVDMLKEVFDQKQKGKQARRQAERKRKKKETTESVEPDETTKQVLLAFNSVMSKSPVSAMDIREMEDKEARTLELQRINREVIEDLDEQYKAVNLELPKEVKKRAGALVSRQIMNPAKS